MNRTFLRSLRGQMLILTAIFLGAVLVAVGVSSSRPWLTGFIRQKHIGTEKTLKTWKIDPKTEKLIASVQNTTLDADIEKQWSEAAEQQWRAIYGRWLDDDTHPPDGPLAKKLIQSQHDRILEFVRRTVVTGSRAQQTKAIALLAQLPVRERAKAAPVLNYLAEKARRRRDSDLQARVQQVLHQP